MRPPSLHPTRFAFLGVLLALPLLLAVPLRAQVVGFTDVFAPENWVFESGGTGSTITWAPDYSSFTLTGSLLYNDNVTTAFFGVYGLTDKYRVSFTWSYTTGDPYGPFYDPAGFNSTQLSLDSGYSNQSGTVPAARVSSLLEFFATSDNWNDPAEGTSSLTISNFTFTLVPSLDLVPTTWENRSGNWTTTANWSNGVPDWLSVTSILDGSTVEVTTAEETYNVHLETSSLNITGGGSLAATAEITADYGTTITVSGTGSTLESDTLELYTATLNIDQSASVVTSYDANTALAADDVTTINVRNTATWTVGDLNLGVRGHGTLNIESGGKVNVTGAGIIGDSDGGGTGTIVVTGSGSQLNFNPGNPLIIGGGTADVTVSGGAVMTSGQAQLGYAGTGVGTVLVTDANSRWEIDSSADSEEYALTVGTSYADESTLTIANGATVSLTGSNKTVEVFGAGSLNIGNGGLAGHLSASSVRVISTINFNHTDDLVFSPAISLVKGTLNKDGSGRLILTGTMSNNSLNNSINLNGGTLQIGNGGNTGTLADHVVSASGTTLAFDRANAFNYSFNYSGDGALVQRGDGVLTLSGTNTHTGGTIVESGTLRGSTGNNFGPAGGTITLAGGNLALASNSEVNFARNVVVTADSTVTADRANNNSTDRTHTLGTLTIGNHTLSIARGSLITGTGGVTFGATTLTGNATFNVGSNALLTLGAVGETGGARSLAKSGSGTLTLGSANTYSGGTTVSAGTLQLSGSGTLGSSTSAVTVAGGTLNLGGQSRTNGAFTLTGGSLTNGTLSASSFALQNGTVSAVLAGSGAAVKSTAGSVTLSGANTYSGGTTVSAGTLTAGHTAAFGSGTVRLDAGTLNLANLAVANALDVRGGSVTGLANYTGTQTLSTSMSYTGTVGGSLVVADGGALHSTGASFTGATTVQSGGHLSGSGSLAGLTLESGSTLAPGDSPGTLTIDGNATWHGGSTYLWEINDANGSPGSAYDLVSISGQLTFNASAENKFTLSLVSLTAANTAGELTGFDPSQPYTHTIASAAGGISGFDSDFVSIDTAGFANALAGGLWSLAADGNNLTLRFTASAIPEPSTYVLLAGLAALVLVILRHRTTAR